MEELVLQEKPGVFSRLRNLFVRPVEAEESTLPVQSGQSYGQSYTVRTAYRYNVTVRRGITTFDDAMEAAQGLKNGDQQILNLCAADPALRQKIVDFICGVNFAQGGTWEEVGENIYIIVPPNGYVEVAPNSARMAGSVR
jgi:cell division inhibitor SepF